MLAIQFRNKHDEQEAAGFVSTINADPYDQTSRIIFADWLEERGYDDEAAIQRNWTKETYDEAFAALKIFANEVCDIPLDELLDGMKERELHLSVSTPDTPDDLWQHYMVVTGCPVPKDQWSGFYISCSC